MSTLAQDEDVAFQRLLLGAGRADAVPGERTATALVRFAASVAAVQTGALLAAGGENASHLAASSWSRGLSAVKWATFGALAGGAITFAWVQHTSAPNAINTAVVAPARNTPTKSETMSLPRAVTPVGAAPLPSAALSVLAVRAAAPTARAAVTPKPNSDLAAEVTALDGIRTALSIGAWQEAELQLARYRREHAQGALRGEAEALAIETLVAQGRKQAATRATERFIAEHPRDPQAARVRALIE